MFRHVAETGPDGGVSPKVERIRRINRLLVDLARDFRAAVIDVDGVLADIGGENLQADFRLGSKLAVKRIGYIIAMGLLSGALGERAKSLRATTGHRFTQGAWAEPPALIAPLGSSLTSR